MAMNLGEIDEQTAVWRQRFFDSRPVVQRPAAGEDIMQAGGRDLSPKINEYVALQPGEVLFAAGALRSSYYRIETGTLAVAVGDAQGATVSHCLHEAGAYLGFGFRDVYAVSAHAIGEATVAQFDNSELTSHMASTPSLSLAYADAVKQEFDILRSLHTRGVVELSPIQKVARILIALSDTADQQGTTLRAVSDLLDCHYIADLAGMSIAELTECVRHLHSQGYLQSTNANDLEILDANGLRALS